MGKRRTAAQIQHLLREAQRDLAKGLTVGDACRKLGISEQTYYRKTIGFDELREELRQFVRDELARQVNGSVRIVDEV